MDLTVLTDLCASMFAACFIILLVFVGMSGEQTHEAPSEQALEATTALHLRPQAVLSAGQMVDILYAHGGAGSGVGIDIFADRVEVSGPGGRAVASIGARAVRDELAAAVGAAGGGPVRLYVFSNRVYNDAMHSVDGMSWRTLEITVPAALRDRMRPEHGWSASFARIEEQRLERAAFREALARLLAGSTSHRGGEGGGTGTGQRDEVVFQHGASDDASLLQRLRRWIARFLTISFTVTGFAALLWIERDRLKMWNISASSGQVVR